MTHINFESKTGIVLTNTGDIFQVIGGGEIPTTFGIKLYKNNAEPNKLDKTSDLLLVKQIDGILRDSTSIIDPSITIEYDKVPDFNYIYIESFNRYYFVTGITSINYNLWSIELECDVLMTYKDQILQQTAFIDKQENNFNADIIDNNRGYEQGFDVEETTIDSEFFTGSSNSSPSYLILGVGVTGGGTKK